MSGEGIAIVILGVIGFVWLLLLTLHFDFVKYRAESAQESGSRAYRAAAALADALGYEICEGVGVRKKPK
jgi:hypothetical protein